MPLFCYSGRMSKRKVTKEDIALGRLVKKLRLSMNIPALEMARSIGVSIQQIRKYESGKNRIPALRLRDIARRLDVSILHLLGEDE